MTTYIHYKCDTCHREIETELDPFRPDLNKCNITYRCEGKLSKTGETRLRSELVPLPQAGLDNWRKRGVEAIAELVEAAPVWVTALSSDNYIAIAVKRVGPPPAINHQLHIILNMLSNSVRPFVEYTYTLAPLTKIVTGLDVNSKNLRFNANDQVFVYVNGVEQYSLDASDSNYHPTLGSYNKDFPSYSIKFKNALVDTSVVKVVVYGVLTHVTYDLTAVKDMNTFSVWGNVKTTVINNETYDVYHANIVNLPINYYFSIHQTLDGSSVIANDRIKLLMSIRPFTYLSRRYDKVLPFNDAIKFNKTLIDEIIDIQVSSDLLEDIYPLIHFERYSGFTDDITEITGYAGTQYSLSSTNINGPSV